MLAVFRYMCVYVDDTTLFYGLNDFPRTNILNKELHKVNT